MLLYFTVWFPQLYRARLIAIFMAGGPIANIVAGPLSVAILGMDGIAGLHGWQWLFLLEGLSAFLASFAVFRLLPHGPLQARWLNPQEKQLIATRLAAEPVAMHDEFWSGLRNFRVVALGIIYFCIVIGIYGFDMWVPQIVQGLGFSTVAVGFLVAVPFGVAMCIQILCGWSSDRHGERIWHIALPVLAAAFGFLVTGYSSSPLLVIAALTLARAGMNASLGPFWSLPSLFLSGPAAAGGLAFINTIGYLGGFTGPAILGVLKQQSGVYSSGMAVMALAMIFAAGVVLMLGRSVRPRICAIPQPAA
jgi:ACS family tartrate transporter-like MFS transporter